MFDGLPPPFQQVPFRPRRYGLSRQKRRERRATDRKAALEEAAADIAPEEKVLLLLAEIAAKANEDSSTGISIAEKDIDEPPDSSNKADVLVSGSVSEATSIAVEAFKTSDEINCEDKSKDKIS